jgi:NADH:ubiquinone oxidoreductase subunit E
LDEPSGLVLPKHASTSYTSKVFQRTERIIADSKNQAGSLVRVLEETQGILGYLPVPILKTISRDLRVPLSEIYGVATFYNFFTLAPRGEHVGSMVTKIER